MMEVLFKCIAVTYLVFSLWAQSMAGPNECTYYYSTQKVRYSRGSSKYYTSCGFLSWSRCTRHSYHRLSNYYYSRASGVDCCSGWRKDSSNLCRIPICSPNCRNGGTCYKPNTCSCRSDNEYYGERNYCSLRCPRISNCQVEQCTSTTDVTCQNCNSNVGATAIAYEKSSNSKQCVSRCSWLSNWCWPGYCTGSDLVADTCTCAPGFSGSPRCLTSKSVAHYIVSNKDLTVFVCSCHIHGLELL
jgi:hypothetical protein